MAVNIEKARENLEKRLEEKREKEIKLFKNATEDFNRIVEMIIKDYSPKRIIQWGSLLNKDLFTEASDIDIAVEGIKTTEDFFSLLGKAETMSDLPLDIVQLEKIDIIHRKSIEEKGKIIYECKK